MLMHLKMVPNKKAKIIQRSRPAKLGRSNIYFGGSIALYPNNLLPKQIATDKWTKLKTLYNPSLFLHQDGLIGILCSYVKKLSGSTDVFTRTNLSKLFLKYLIP